jgi:signal transduction histidine kinase
MEKDKESPCVKIGCPGYINKNCWVVATLNSPSSERCRYCELKFHNCMFFQYLIISLTLAALLLGLSFIVEGDISKLMVTSIVTLTLVYGVFFNKSTDKVIKAAFDERKAKEAFQEVAEVKCKFVSVAAHQLRTPLGGIRWAIQSLMDGKKEVSEEQRETLVKTHDATLGLIDIVNDLLNITQVDEGRMTLSMKENNIIDTINMVMSSCCILTKEKKIDISFENKAHDLKPFTFDHEKMSMALRNVLHNAIDYTKGNGRIAITLSCDEKNVMITVVDTGIGMDEEEQKQLFTKFYRADPARLMETDRSGLGLFLAKEIIDEHKGTIAVISKKEEGTKVEITLPYNKVESKK